MASLSTPKLVIFDCDGTLVDTEVLHTRVFVEMMHENGMNVIEADVDAVIAARSLAFAYNAMREHFGWTSFGHHEEQEYLERFEALIKQAGPDIAVKNALETVIKTAKKTPIAVATNGEADLTHLKLNQTGYFDALPGLKWYTKNLVENPKPAPDLFLYVAREFNAEPKDCWVIEDSATGVTAAVAAGMHCIGFTGCAHDKKTTAESLKNCGAALIFDDYKDFPLANL